ncbi:Histone acetyltransferase [Tieghemiomyces parasiticus]|uniref:histone acetyltransferase n=1 Tax=Tieghemiomyces parasiticus TaxID=78921 RepID=A0A9W8AIG9_9FUNG|nr:Histone acetyltransferase [Tieghemiomyces parasiticus]
MERADRKGAAALGSSPAPSGGDGTPSGVSGTPNVSEPDAMQPLSSLDEIKVGCKVFVEKSVNPAEPEYRKAEILSIRTVKATRAEIRLARERATEHSGPDIQSTETLQYYVHYSEFNKRLDEWIRPDRIELSRGIEFPKAKRPRGGDSGGNSGPGTPGGRTPKVPRKSGAAAGRTPFNREARSTAGTPGPDGSPAATTGAKSTAVGPGDPVAEEDGTAVAPVGPVGTYSKEIEIEKLRTSGSMTQSISEVSRVKNLNRVVIGRHEVEAWYFSPYPEEFAHADTVYICEFCFSYFISHRQLERHCMHCTLQHPPGNEIYRQDEISFFEIDGRKQKVYCRNLCLISKLFLDHKTLYYDVDPFLFYVMTVTDDHGAHTIGYFSKEKESLDNYNLACILTLPQYQRMGYGRVLIAFSYELSKAEGKIGSPEKPLSDLGLLSYRAYWSETLVDKLVRFKGELSIDELSHMTSFTTQDILHTLQSIDALKYYRGQHIICLNDSVIENYYKAMKKKRRTIDPQALQWKPPHFSAAELRYI